MTRFVNPNDFKKCIYKMRNFFKSKGFIDLTPTHCTKNIISCYQDHKHKTIWPLSKCEHTLLLNPDKEGYFGITNYNSKTCSYMMFEFEGKGNINNLINIEKELMEYIGFEKNIIDNRNFTTNISNVYDLHTKNQMLSKALTVEYKDYHNGDYNKIIKALNVKNIGKKEEKLIQKKYGDIFLLKNIPRYESQFWNTNFENNIAKHVDVIVHGQKTIYSCERSCDIEQMYETFNTILNGQYADTLHNMYGDDIENELHNYFSNIFFNRYGGNIDIIGMTRGMTISNLLN